MSRENKAECPSCQGRGYSTVKGFGEVDCFPCRGRGYFNIGPCPPQEELDKIRTNELAAIKKEKP